MVTRGRSGGKQQDGFPLQVFHDDSYGVVDHDDDDGDYDDDDDDNDDDGQLW